MKEEKMLAAKVADVNMNARRMMMIERRNGRLAFPFQDHHNFNVSVKTLLDAGKVRSSACC